MSETSTAANHDFKQETCKIRCCECGTFIQSNCRNMCLSCMQRHVDLTQKIPKQSVLSYCRKCERYLQPTGDWLSAAWQSRELLRICLKKLKHLKQLQLEDAVFLWTERHSKRIKLELTVRACEADTWLQQQCVVEFTVQNEMCMDCHRIEAKNYWRCLLQLRQHAENKKTFYNLEQLILKQRAHANTVGIKRKHGGLNFYYAHEQHARKMLDFLHTVVPIKVTTSRRLESHDKHNNQFHYKYTWSVEIAPMSKDSAVCLPKKLRQQLGNIAPLCLVHKVGSGIHLLDPLTAQRAELNAQCFFRAPFEAICNPKQLLEYIVMDIERDGDIWLLPAANLGLQQHNIHTRSHLADVLQIGDMVLGYNFAESNINNDNFEQLKAEQLPDVLLVRKSYSKQQLPIQKRKWKLQHMAPAEHNDDEQNKHDYQEFLQELEEDADYREQFNVYDCEDDNIIESELPEQPSLSASLANISVQN